MEGQCRQLARKARVWHSAKHRALRPTTAVRVPAIAPLDFDWRSATSAQTQRIIQQRYPELTDLVQSGVLVAWPRPDDYQERREDGYEEPHLLLLVGTAHVSETSPRDVERVILATRPDAVVVELCRSRSAVMAEPITADNTAAVANGDTHTTQGPLMSSGGSREDSDADSSSEDTHNPQPSTHTHTAPTQPHTGVQPPVTQHSSTSINTATAAAPVLSLTGDGGVNAQGRPLGMAQALQRSASLGGQSGLLLRLLLAALAQRSADALGVRGGGEFLMARRAAEAVEAQVVLGDRPIEITLQRAWSALNTAQRVKLCWDLGRAAWSASPQSLSAEMVERLRSDDALSGMLQAMSERYPELLGPLVHERDQYLAWSLKRSKAVRGARVVVGVMGAGHMRGVVHALQTDRGGDTLRFSDLVGNLNKKSEKRRQMLQAAQRFAIETALFLAAYEAWVAYGPNLSLP